MKIQVQYICSFLNVHLLRPSFYRFPFAQCSRFSLSSPLLTVLSISITTFISITVCLSCCSLKEYIQDADKSNGPLAGSFLQLWLGRHFSSNTPFSCCLFPSRKLSDSNSQNDHHALGLCKFDWRLWTCRLHFDERQETQTFSAPVSNIWRQDVSAGRR